MMQLTEELVSGMAKAITGDFKVVYHTHSADQDPAVIDFSPPFKRISIIPGLEQATGLKFPAKFDSPEARQFLVDVVQKHQINCPPPHTEARLLDKLCEHFLEPQCSHPTFLIDHPEVMSPLAKWHRTIPGVTERFELFVLGMELCNSYTELNDPKVQRERFTQQEKDRLADDDEAQQLDETFCLALEYGLPPTAGWGLGIDRMTMFLSDNFTIKEVILFPAMKPIETALVSPNQNQGKPLGGEVGGAKLPDNNPTTKVKPPV